MDTLDKRNETYGLDCKISPSMLARHEVLTQESIGGQGTGISVQELINALCDVLDGSDVVDIHRNTGVDADHAKRIDEIRNQVRELWTYPDGRLVIG